MSRVIYWTDRTQIPFIKPENASETWVWDTVEAVLAVRPLWKLDTVVQVKDKIIISLSHIKPSEL